MKINILTIAGNDILSGGGLQADLATIAALKGFAFVAQTCLTSSDGDGFDIHPISGDLFQKQLDSFKEMSFDGIKIGLLPNSDILNKTDCFLRDKQTMPVVLDPVLVFKENDDHEVSRMKEKMISLFPYATIVTPNLKEAQLLSGIQISNKESMLAAAKYLHSLGAKHIVIKGGNRFSTETATDLFYDGQQAYWLEKPLLDLNNNGAGCTFATAITLNLAIGKSVKESVIVAKDFVYQAIKNSNEYGVQVN